ncbi:carbohydrate ABC transporter permease [Microbacterium sp. ASV49]|uniref:Carbohydrate ABC transporter permease n=1 Tax=Microbacterium candidum TaxID=3041922 RepID=A0ABT7MWI7_9MICO|nr:carbohydrate ABC transporter permease [Microbacterium sp. ASV49]MDL9978813.1 carbohydrate ABC transporter permease [Microbacterium sp. ASV49]
MSTMTEKITAPAVDTERVRKRRIRDASEEKRRPHIVLTIVLGVVAVAWLFPLLGVVITSFRTSDAVQGPNATAWWTVFTDPANAGWTLSSYGQAVDALNLPTAFFNSLAVVIPATVLPIMFAAMAAYAFTFLDFKGKEIYFSVILALLVVPVQIAIIPILQFFVLVKNVTGIQVIGEFPAAWIVHAAFALPLAIYILRNYMSTLPNSLIEAARVDGASHFTIFWRLVVPMSVPALASFAIFQFLWVWNDFLVAYIFIGTGPNAVLTQGLYDLLGQYGQGWQRVAAGSIITVVVPLAIFFALQRYFVRGLTAGSVK